MHSESPSSPRRLFHFHEYQPPQTAPTIRTGLEEGLGGHNAIIYKRQFAKRVTSRRKCGHVHPEFDLICERIALAAGWHQKRIKKEPSWLPAVKSWTMSHESPLTCNSSCTGLASPPQPGAPQATAPPSAIHMEGVFRLALDMKPAK